MTQKTKKYLFITITTAIASQISVGIYQTSFKISGGVIAFCLLLYLFDNINIISLGFQVGISVFILRFSVFYFNNGHILNSLINSIPSCLFYIIYAVIFYYFLKKELLKNKFKYFSLIFMADSLSNLSEISFRYFLNLIDLEWNIIFIVFLAAFIRTIVIWIALLSVKYYKILLIRKEKLNRYENLVILSSELMSELYWMEKTKNNMENVMSTAYNLHENIKNQNNKNEWAASSLNIAKEIHEIKKNNNLILNKLKKLTEHNINSDYIHFSEIIEILEFYFNNHLEKKNINLIFNCNIEKNFIVRKDYYIMCVFRNFINNAIESFENKNESEIKFNCFQKNNNYVFKIIDNGSGIKKENIDLIFSAGFSTKIDYATGNINRGLGLSITQEIINDIYNGEIIVNTENSKGTTFKIKIPKKRLEEN
jgi:two-component system sensor histidine kinase YcbA